MTNDQIDPIEPQGGDEIKSEEILKNYLKDHLPDKFKEGKPNTLLPNQVLRDTESTFTASKDFEYPSYPEGMMSSLEAFPSQHFTPDSALQRIDRLCDVAEATHTSDIRGANMVLARAWDVYSALVQEVKQSPAEGYGELICDNMPQFRFQFKELPAPRGYTPNPTVEQLVTAATRLAEAMVRTGHAETMGLAGNAVRQSVTDRALSELVTPYHQLDQDKVYFAPERKIKDPFIER
jgi:hypothetical protein